MSTSTVKRFTPTPGREFIWYWYAITAVVVSWDIGYCFLRPRSMPGGDLHWIWKPYAIYVNIDYIYGFPALKANNGFTNAQTFMNVIETGLNVIYVYLGPSSAVAPLIGFTSAAMTLAKTMLYFLQEYYCGWCMVGHNTLPDLLQYWILPNVLWFIFPIAILYILGKDLVNSLRIAQRIQNRPSDFKANGKSH